MVNDEESKAGCQFVEFEDKYLKNMAPKYP
jgi:hypothetical protein